ncbi:L(+)-tartrate dehydratase subunit beta [Ruminococcus gauvreauii]|uniref:L(+)-tartrate dehydratase subunit beta n=1 Tax=Ruminococcus gauvreauii TaxID=438033 RepID=A0ABY5VE70_9FIRM|nr:L(+)-tartrate dehydratase subunit beta [Ruminococcus gauvreauii]UWP58298.1 L(+)-tartrate dehydratase subunit beta [Ruminococcus gauvreauii]
MREFYLTTPISNEDIKNLRIGDIVYLNGIIVTCRDIAHRRVVEERRPLPVDVRDKAILHAGPIIKANADGTFQMISVGPTTSMRMEKFEEEFMKETGVKLIVGKGGMGIDTQNGCMKYHALHLVYPAGNAVLAAQKVEQILDVQWAELGMPEALWVCKVKGYGPLIVSIDTQGNNLFEQNRLVFNERKETEIARICREVGFIK